MLTMEFKGITWIGNVYQKFEAMCLEVEDVMYQETVKYVESQAHTVGASVKKFYSDVMQDLVPPVDPVKVAAADLSLNLYADFDIHKKPKAKVKADSIHGNKQATEDLKPVVDVTERYLGLHRDGAICEHPNVVMRRKSKNNHSSSRVLTPVTCVSEGLAGASSGRQITKNNGALPNPISVQSSSDSARVTELELKQGKLGNEIVGSTALLAEAANGFPVRGMVDSNTNPQAKRTNTESNAKSTCTNGPLVAQTESHGGSGSASEDPLSDAGRLGEETNLDVIEEDDLLGLETEAPEQSGKSELEETCVLVDGDKFCLVSQKEDKPKSYKKKIRKALSSKRAARKQEYKQLAAQYGDLDARLEVEPMASLVTSFMESGVKKNPTLEISESEWELL